MIPKIDENIGILVYTTRFEGSSGVIKNRFEDFVVSEIISERVRISSSQNDGFAVYKLKKYGIDTTHALERIYRAHGARLKALGLKDASALTEQFVCSTGKNKILPDVTDAKISLTLIGFVSKPLSAKDMIGNRFTIKVTGLSADISAFNEYDRILNFYGYQRFGSKRAVTHLVGKALVQRRFSDALSLALSFVSEYDDEKNTALRKIMSDPSKYAEALQQIPPGMDIEKILLQEMIAHQNPQKAFARLPLSMRRFYVDAYQSYLFNLTLSKAYQSGEELFEPQAGDVCYDKNSNLGRFEMDPNQKLAIPIIGYSYFKKTRFESILGRILENEEISAKDFYFKEMQELSSEGGFRSACIKCADFAACDDTIEFTLPRGSYATIVLREILKPKDPLLAGF